ncbi:hypothetical protein Pan97_02660 [Bremerella volcania]|uniref:Uncharacterized protein n=1 Tax=Bremerella volcania TaxID=2527984 RepID=A0A518C245_9BACT|nr:hypothetical protein Pan97_02660 [Bremerella volcania]
MWQTENEEIAKLSLIPGGWYTTPQDGGSDSLYSGFLALL